MKHGQILITQTDRLRLSSILESESPHNTFAAELKAKIDQSVAVDKAKTPRDLVTMNTMFRGVIQHEGWPDPSSVRILTLTYPRHADISNGGISVLTPLGIELLGAREGDVVNWPEQDGHSKKMLIDEIIFQPESSGDWQL